MNGRFWEQVKQHRAADIVKDIGRRQAYDILQSRKPRLLT
jgi:hypothetical protein